MKTTALIDGDILLYRSAYRAEIEVEFEDEVILKSDLKHARNSLTEDTAQIVNAVGAHRAIICLSDMQHNFRKDIYHPYKLNRAAAGKRKPTGYKALRRWYEENYTTICKPGLEADDVMGILATKPTKKPARIVVCSIDKDLLTIPGHVYNWNHPEDGVEEVTLWEADYNFYYQILVGDSTDNYPGCPGVGPVKAKKLLDEIILMCEADLWETVTKAFTDAGQTIDDALVQARCARILRACDYDFEKEEVIPWSPNVLSA